MVLLSLLAFLLNTSVWAKDFTVDVTSTHPHDLELVTSGTDALRLFLREIESAQQSVSIETYVGKSDESLWLILNAAIERRAQGIPVRIIFDWYGSQLNKGGLSKEQLCLLLQKGLQVGFYNPRMSRILRRNHRKQFIVDGKRVSSGGRNFSNLNFGLNGQHNRLDYTFTLSGPIAQASSQSFNEYWESGEVTQLPHCASSSIASEQMDTRELRDRLMAQPFSPAKFRCLACALYLRSSSKKPIRFYEITHSALPICSQRNYRDS